MHTMNSVRPAAPVAPWQGGKKALYKTLIERIELIPHKTYIEPFVGMGGVFLRRGFKPQLEVANDLNGEIINLFRIAQRHLPALIAQIDLQIVSRAEFERLRRTPPDTLTDLERAARFVYLQRLAFGGNPKGVFGAQVDRPRFTAKGTGDLLRRAQARLDGVVLESLDWSEVIRRYDGAHSLFYLDPPYFGVEADYGKDMFAREDFKAMADQLREIKGAFVMSINDRPEIRDWFDGFHIDEARLTYTAGTQGGKKVQELIISNREARAGLI